jgi:hypothetical protein
LCRSFFHTRAPEFQARIAQKRARVVVAGAVADGIPVTSVGLDIALRAAELSRQL